MAIVAFVAGLVIGLFGCFLRQPSQVTVTTLDTILIEKPVPYEVAHTEFRTLRLPVMLFAPADTVWNTRLVVDSVEVEVAMERKTYQDSTYRAQVSGPAIGGLHPSLDWIEVYNKTTYNTTTVKKTGRWGLGVQVGYGAYKEGLSPYIGVGISYNLITF